MNTNSFLAQNASQRWAGALESCLVPKLRFGNAVREAQLRRTALAALQVSEFSEN